MVRLLGKMGKGPGPITRSIKQLMPRGLLARSIIIIVAPMVLLQIVTTFLFMERHSELVTRRLSRAVAGEVAFAVHLYENKNSHEEFQAIARELEEKERIETKVIREAKIPKKQRHPTFSLMSEIIHRELSASLDYPFWYNLRSEPSRAEIQVQVGNDILSVKVRRSRLLATNWHIFLVWLTLSSILLLTIAIIFLRNQIRPIQRLALAAERFGKGRDVPNFKPSGAQEVRNAAIAFIDMRNRMQRYISQRTDLLSGVSHDLRTPLTRLKLSLAMMGDTDDIKDMKADVAEMEKMVEAYLAFTRGQESEETERVDISEMLAELVVKAEKLGAQTSMEVENGLEARLKPGLFRRCIANLIDNAVAHADTIRITAHRGANNWLIVKVEDDGIGIPEPLYEEAFKPFRRLDQKRKRDLGGTGLGLSIAKDIARAHGGDIKLSPSRMGGLKVCVEIPT